MIHCVVDYCYNNNDDDDDDDHNNNNNNNNNDNNLIQYMKECQKRKCIL